VEVRAHVDLVGIEGVRRRDVGAVVRLEALPLDGGAGIRRRADAVEDEQRRDGREANQRTPPSGCSQHARGSPSRSRPRDARAEPSIESIRARGDGGQADRSASSGSGWVVPRRHAAIPAPV
jgi:hypothetical protein